MNELPDDLWQAERSLMRATLARYASDAEEDTSDSLSITDESVLLVGLGLLAIAYSCAVMVFAAVMGGLSLTLISRKLKGFMSHRIPTNGVSHVSFTDDGGYGY